MTHSYKFERRRYGNTTFTWAWVDNDGQLLSLGDPWPCITPKRAELDAAADRVVADYWRQARSGETIS